MWSGYRPMTQVDGCRNNDPPIAGWVKPLLLRSGLTHPAIGGSLFLHPSTWVIGLYPDHIGSWEGPPNSVYSDQFATLEGNYGFMLESIPAHPGSIAFTLPWFAS